VKIEHKELDLLRQSVRKLKKASSESIYLENNYKDGIIDALERVLIMAKIIRRGKKV